ncbi:MAG: hypothetical protein IKW66_02950, partial [Clostridia bacterium]|nr:hypothetical protein [Clostridia bacterium]
MKNSCGRDAFCRDGMKQLYLHSRDITEGRGTTDDVELLQDLVQTMSQVSNCTLSDEALSLFALSLQLHEQ